MARVNRAEVFNPREVSVWHCINRCVRRCFLCGVDRLTGKDFEYRKTWLSKRILELGDVFATGIYAFIPDQFLMQAVMWNLNTYGYVRVQVSPKEYAAAKEFLLAAP